MIKDLTRKERDKLFEVLTAAIWADGEAAPEEIDLLTDVILQLDLDKEEMDRAAALLHARPRLEEIDIQAVPHGHRQQLIETVRKAVLADGELGKAERAMVAAIGSALQVPIALPDDEDESE
jgi:uncharacterized tellurite resistance protein B-like protein